MSITYVCIFQCTQHIYNICISNMQIVSIVNLLFCLFACQLKLKLKLFVRNITSGETVAEREQKMILRDAARVSTATRHDERRCRRTKRSNS